MINTKSLFSTINFYMCTLYCFYFLLSRVVQSTPYAMILVVLIFIVKWKFKLFHWNNILLCYYRLYCCCSLIIVIIIIIYLLLLSFSHLFIYLFIYIYYFIYLFFCGLGLYKVQPFQSSPRLKFTIFYIAYI